jgi:uncharacterized protein (TIGR03118 family)
MGSLTEQKFNSCCNPCYNPCCVPTFCAPPLPYNKFNRVNLVSNINAYSQNLDSNLRNAWGIVLINNQIWIADNANNTLSTYTLDGTIQPALVTVSSSSTITIPAPPTGIAYNSSLSSYIFTGTNPFAYAAIILTCTSNGYICGYNAGFNPNAIPVYISPVANANYTGLAVTSSNIYAANFGNYTVDVLDSTFLPVNYPFKDVSLFANFSPFNIVSLNGLIYVLYAQRDITTGAFITGAGIGYINVFDTTGTLLNRFASNGPLNAPWGMISSPINSNFPTGSFLVGNFGDGTISIYNSTGTYLGKLIDACGKIIFIDGLWGLANGPTGISPPVSTTFLSRAVYFASGPNSQVNGIVGRLTQVECQT